MISCLSTYKQRIDKDRDVVTDVSRSLPHPQCICPTSWASIRISVYYRSKGSFNHDNAMWDRMYDRRELIWDVLSVVHKLTLRRGGKGGGILIRAYQGKGSAKDHQKFLRLEKLAHALAQKPMAVLQREYRKALKKQGRNVHGLP